MSKETPVFDDKIEEFMYKEGLCEECKKESEEVGFVDSFCEECHDKFMKLCSLGRKRRFPSTCAQNVKKKR